MRIIGGEFRGRRIVAPKGTVARPTTDRTRESLFNILAHRPGFSFEALRVIDLFAGSGALGLEALSRGAAFCLFVETDPAARGAIRENIETLALFGRTKVHSRSATRLGPLPASAAPPFDLAFLDPPYGKGLIAPALNSLSAGGWLSPGALVVVEHPATEEVPPPKAYTALTTRRFGDSALSLLTAL